MPARVQVRLPDEDLARWVDAARVAGMPLSGFVRTAVERYIGDRTTAAVARAVSHDLLPEIGRMLDERLPSAASVIPGTSDARLERAMAFKAEMPEGFDPSCFDRDLHQRGVVCPTCRGSF